MIRKNKQAGFSLVELMVVVAIIGVLASVAIPSFTKFQRRARAVEGKTILSSHYNASKAFFAEWENYTPSLPAIGFTYEGQTRSRFLSGSASGVAGNTAARFSLEAQDAFANTVTGVANNHILASICPNAIFAPACQASAGNPPPAAFITDNTAYNFNANGNLSTWISQVSTNVGGAEPEEWTMTQAKVMAQVTDGINSN